MTSTTPTRSRRTRSSMSRAAISSCSCSRTPTPRGTSSTSTFRRFEGKGPRGPFFAAFSRRGHAILSGGRASARPGLRRVFRRFAARKSPKSPRLCYNAGREFFPVFGRAAGTGGSFPFSPRRFAPCPSPTPPGNPAASCSSTSCGACPSCWSSSTTAPST